VYAGKIDQKTGDILRIPDAKMRPFFGDFGLLLTPDLGIG
jgi:hypothetical protein